VLNDFLKIEMATLFSPFWYFSMKNLPNDQSGETLFLKKFLNSIRKFQNLNPSAFD
jgi:hypothetical protein